MNLDTMTIEQKIIALETCISKAQLDVNYSYNVSWGNDMEQALSTMKTIIISATRLFRSGQLDQLDYDIRNQTVESWHNVLNSELMKFPEYMIIKNNKCI